MHLIEFREMLRDAEVANAISPIVRGHHLTEDDTRSILIELRVPRAVDVAAITHHAFPAAK